jgi:hypothetical protein
MKTITKIAAGALLAAGLAVAATAPADAGVRIGFGFPVVAGPAEPATCYDAYGQPYYCGYRGNYAPGYVTFGFGGHRDWHGGDRDGFRGGHDERGGWHR